MKERPLFSIIIPVYNVEKYLQECVQSVLKQNYTNYQLILVDDGSIDNSSSICDELAKRDNRIEVIHKQNEGVSIARKAAVQIAKGKYVFCIDADDWIYDNCLENIAKVINKQEVDIVCYGMTFEKGNKMIQSELPYREGYYSKSDIEKEIYPLLIHDKNAGYFSPTLWGKAIKTELFIDNLLANKSATIGEDGACVIPCVYNAESMYIIKDCYYYYRYNDSSATKARKSFDWNYPEIVNEHIISKVDMSKFDFNNQMNRKIAHDFFNAAYSQFYNEMSYKEIKNDILNHMKKEIYRTAIDNAHYKRTCIAWFMLVSLKQKWIFLLYLYAKIKKIIKI